MCSASVVIVLTCPRLPLSPSSTRKKLEYNTSRDNIYDFIKSRSPFWGAFPKKADTESHSIPVDSAVEQNG
jgi:hypothetical protein